MDMYIVSSSESVSQVLFWLVYTQCFHEQIAQFYHLFLVLQSAVLFVYAVAFYHCIFFLHSRFSCMCMAYRVCHRTHQASYERHHDLYADAS